MTPADLAALHGAAFAPERGWRAAEFTELCASPHVHLFTRPGGFALVRAVAGEAELLTLATAPDRRREGIADALMTRWMQQIKGDIAFLEVAADNHAARALYAKHGFAPVSLRKAYYTRPNGPAADAVLMQAALTIGQAAELGG